MTNRVRLLTVWSGPLPSYLPLFLMTAGRNPEFEFVFVADSPAPVDRLRHGLPENVIWVERSYAELFSQIGDQLDIPTRGLKPLKLCDFKPTFGHVFRDLFGDTDFWGHIDCDILLGHLGRFITDDVLNTHDVLGLRGRGFTHGPLTLYRNTESVNSLFAEAAHWKQTLSNPNVLGFDESCGWWAWRGQTRPPDAPDSMTDVIYRAVSAGRASNYDENHINEEHHRFGPLFIRWNDGTLTDLHHDREIAYYHLVHSKKDPFFYIPAWDALPSSFHVNKYGIQTGDETSLPFHLSRLLTGTPAYSRSLASHTASKMRAALSA
ncbi:MAG: hypothetical protein Rubg2KO_27240 [Rubricoccaceae bacterium]